MFGREQDGTYNCKREAWVLLLHKIPRSSFGEGLARSVDAGRGLAGFGFRDGVPVGLGKVRYMM